MSEIVHVAHMDTSRHMGPGRSVPSLCRAEVGLGRDAVVINYRENTIYQPQVSESFRPLREGEVAGLLTSAWVVHFNGVFHPPYHGMALRCRRAGVPYLLCPRSNLVRRAVSSQSTLKKRLALALWVDRLIRHSHGVHFLTPAEAEASRDVDTEILIAPNGVELHEEDEGLRATAERGRVILYIGRLDVNQKGLDRLIDFAFRWQGALRDRGWNVHVHGPDHRGGRDRLVSRIEGEGLTDVVRLQPPIGGREKLHALRSARVFVHPSRFEGQPQAVLEAMAEGCPVILSEGSNMLREVLDAGCGFGWEEFFDRAPPILHRLQDPARSAELDRKARHLVERDYTWEAAARRTLSEFERVLG